MATIKELLSAMIDKINGNEDKIDNIKGVPEAFDSITMTNGTDMANLTMSAEKELLFNGEAVGGGDGDNFVVTINGENQTADKSATEIIDALRSGKNAVAIADAGDMIGYVCQSSGWQNNGKGDVFALFSSTYALSETNVMNITFAIGTDKSITMYPVSLTVKE